MRAVNLIPTESRRGGGVAAGQSGGIVYVLLAALAGLVIMGVLYAVYDRQAADRRSQLMSASAQAVAAQGEATRLNPYVVFQKLSQQRTQTLTMLANGRFNWSRAMDQIARALPLSVTLTTLSGGAQAQTGAPAAPGPAAAPPSGPLFTLAGCARNHAMVGSTLSQLRAIPGALKVSLTTSSKEGGTAQPAKGSAPGAAPAGGGATNGVVTTCPYVTFQGSVTFSTDAVVRVAPPNARGAAPVQVTSPTGPATATTPGATTPGATTTQTTPRQTTPTQSAPASPVTPAGAAARANGAAAGAAP